MVELVDDLDGTASDDIGTVEFGLDGVSYEIDLTEVNAGRLLDTLAEFVAVARRTGARLKRGTSAGKPAARLVVDREQTRAIREWARQHGFDLADRGRIPATVMEAFEQAQAAAAKPKSRCGKSTATQPASALETNTRCLIPTPLSASRADSRAGCIDRHGMHVD